MSQRLVDRLRARLLARVTAFLTRPIGHYERYTHNDLALLKRHARKGDVLLVEGDQRVSAIIKTLTHSSWSHAAIYVGDELLRRDDALRERTLAAHGDEAQHMVVEALMDGVVAAPLAKYTDYNVRLCRPHRLRTVHLRAVLDEAIEAIGFRYDLRNVVELALHLLSVALMPGRWRRDALRFGSGAARQVICTSLIGRLFHHVGFPVLPSRVSWDDEPRPALPPRRWPFRNRPRYEGLYRRRHPTLLMPRDFDLSPYFEIVKFNVTKQRGFDYERIAWAEDPTRDDVAERHGHDAEADRGLAS